MDASTLARRRSDWVRRCSPCMLFAAVQESASGARSGHVEASVRMSASLIGRLGQALSGYLPLQCRCRSRARASLRTRHQGSSIMGFEDEVEQSFGRPCRQCNGRLKRTNELTSYCRRIAQHPHVFHPPAFHRFHGDNLCQLGGQLGAFVRLSSLAMAFSASPGSRCR